jgi:hypothetical protein
MSWRTPIALTLLFAALAALAAATLSSRDPEPSADDVAAAAAYWVGTGQPQPPRRNGDEGETDVARPNGSLVEVTLGRGLELLGFDEERSRGGGPAPDELRGPSRARAVQAALPFSGPGRVIGVERERGGAVEVGVRRPDGTQVEVGLDRRLRMLDVERENLDDE